MAKAEKARAKGENDGAAAQPTRDRLIEAATAEFARTGFQGARVDEIARLAGINKQLVYHYFGSKDALYVAVLEQAYLRFRGDEKMIEAAVSEIDPEVALRKLAAFLFSRSSTMNGFQQLIQDLNIKSNNRHLKSLDGVREAYSRLIDGVADILDRGAKTGQFRSGLDPREFYISLAGVFSVRINNAATMSYVLGVDLLSRKGIQQSQDYAFKLLLDGIRTPP